jgi:hypothetical protein
VPLAGLLFFVSLHLIPPRFIFLANTLITPGIRPSGYQAAGRVAE